MTTLDDVGLSTKTVATFDVTGSQPSKVQTWDYYSGAAPSTPTTETDYTYYSGSFPSAVMQKDGTGNVISQTTYSYDQTTPTATSGLPNHGAATGVWANLTTIAQLINSSGTTLSQTSAYDDAGTVLTSTDPNGTTTYGHDNTDTFVTSTTPPTPSSGVSLTNTATYDFSTGLLTSTTDPNGAETKYANYDWAGRALEIDNLDGSGAMVGRKTFLYDPPYSSAYDYQNASVYADTETMYDAYGRQSRVAVANGQSANPWYQSDTCYNTNGNVSFQSYSYQGAGFDQTKECSGGGDSTSYDALGRVTNVTHADGSATAYKYTGRAMEQTDVNPSETNVSRITQTDGLGRETIACEVSSNSTMAGGSGSPISCGTDIAATGFVTSFAYNLASHTQTITQGVQTRTFQTDSLGRTILTNEPERGQTTYSYSYNATGLQVLRQRPAANQTSSSDLTTTTIQYDALGRLLQMSYNDNLTSQRTFTYDAACCWTNASSATNLKGRLANTGAGLGSLNNAASLYSYDSLGRVTELWQCTPSNCGSASLMASRPITMTYDWTGNVLQEYDPVSGVIAYGRSRAGEVTSITQETYENAFNPAAVVSNVVNGPSGPVSYNLGNGLEVGKTYDSMGRPNSSYTCVGSTSQSCSGGSRYVFGNGIVYTGNQLEYDCDTVAYASYGNCLWPHYDDMGRVATATSNSGPVVYTWTYDRYGNRWSQTGQGNFSASFDTTTNRLNSSPYTYDAAGNLTYDGQHHYTYDAEGNVVDVDLNQGNTASYVYNVWNQRVVEQETSGSYEYLYDPSGLRTSTWEVANDAGVEGRIYWDGQQIAFRDIDGTTYFDHQDYLGTERVRTDYQGATAAQYISGPFGDGYSASLATPNSDQDNLHFAGMEQDAETATEHATFRQYSPAQGRWMSPDPYDGSYDYSTPASFNRYAYVLNNPLSFTDPSGQFAPVIPPTVCAAGAEACGIAIGVDAAEAAVLYGVVDGLKDLFGGLFGPSFSGTLQARPNSQPWDDTFGVPSDGLSGNIANALGLPDAGCEFGSCGAQPSSSYQAAGGAIAGTIACQFLEPCGAAEDGAAVIGVIGYGIIQMSQHGRGNQADTGVMQDVHTLYPNLPVCQALDLLAATAKGDPKKLAAINKTKKAYGCKRSRESR